MYIIFYVPLIQLPGDIGEASEEADVSNDTNKLFKLPPGTTVAYDVCELLVRGDGSMLLIVDEDYKGGGG